MKNILKKSSMLIIGLLMSGCATMKQVEDIPNQEPSSEAHPITKLAVSHIANLSPPDGPPITIAVYNFGDKTGQRKPNDTMVLLSSAVTQGSEVFLIKALQDAGHGKWFQVVERVGLDDLVKERQLIRSQRDTYEGKDAKPLPPMLIAGVMLEGGVVGYDSNVGSGGVGAGMLGISASTQYRTDVVTVIIRLINVQTGEVLISAGATKTILSAGVSGNVMMFLDQGTKDVQYEAGYNVNEPSTYAVRVAIEGAVEDMIKQGVAKNLWHFAKTPKKSDPKPQAKDKN
jgi:curli production assembly/transport component CsgG